MTRLLRIFVITVGEVRQVGSQSRLKRDVPLGLARSTRALSAKCWVCWGDWLALPGRKPGALQSIEGSNPSTPTKTLYTRGCSLKGESSRLSIEQMPVRIRSAAPTIYHAVG